MSPLLSTITEFGKIGEYKLRISTISQSGSYNERGTLNCKVGYGYLANQSDKCIALTNNMIALNSNRNQIRYVYGTKIPYSVLSNKQNISVTYSIKDSTLSSIYSATTTITNNEYLVDTEFTIPN